MEDLRAAMLNNCPAEFYNELQDIVDDLEHTLLIIADGLDIGNPEGLYDPDAAEDVVKELCARRGNTR